MIKTVSVKEMQDFERAYMASKADASELMERAGEACASKIASYFKPEEENFACIFCGPGGNGGDGFVIARRLAEQDIPCFCFAVPGENGDFKPLTETKRIAASSAGVNITLAEDGFKAAPDFKKAFVAVDALLGLGAGGYKPRSIYQQLADLINSSRRIISIDGPTGINMDSGAKYLERPVKADETYTFGFIKRGLVASEAKQYTGILSVLDIFA